MQGVEVQICEDDNGKPGNIVSTNIIDLNVNNFEGAWYSFLILDECLRTHQAIIGCQYYLWKAQMQNGYSEEDSLNYK